MENTNLFNYINLGISICTVVFALVIFVVYDRKLKTQDRALNQKLDIIYKSQIDKLEEEADNRKKADFLVVKHNDTRGKYEFSIRNVGYSRAKNIRIGENSLTEDNGVFICTLDSFECLDPNNCYDFSLICSEGHKTDHFIYLIWDDEYKVNNVKDFRIYL